MAAEDKYRRQDEGKDFPRSYMYYFVHEGRKMWYVLSNEYSLYKKLKYGLMKYIILSNQSVYISVCIYTCIYVRMCLYLINTEYWVDGE